jgi:UDP-N-acetylglucosamine enolpyruvyl transferase
MGLKYKILKNYFSYNERTKLADIEIYPSKLKAPYDKIHANPYPGINMDNLPFFVPIAIKATGVTMVHDWVYENRAIYFTELNRLGADITLADPHRVFVSTVAPELKPAQVVCPPALRPSMAIMISMLGAKWYINTTQCIHDQSWLRRNCRTLKFYWCRYKNSKIITIVPYLLYRLGRIRRLFDCDKSKGLF